MKEINFEQSIDELEITVKKLENGDCSLDESIKLFEQGVQLTSKCLQELNNAQLKIAKLLKGKTGEMTAKAMDMEELGGE